MKDLFINDYIIQTIAAITAIFQKFTTYGIFKILSAVLLVAAGFLFGVNNFEFLLGLIVLIGIDFISGVWAAKCHKEAIESRKILKTAIKFNMYLFSFAAAHITGVLVGVASMTDGWVLAYLGVTEFISVGENMAKMGFKFPAKLLNILQDKAGIDK